MPGFLGPWNSSTRRPYISISVEIASQAHRPCVVAPSDPCLLTGPSAYGRGVTHVEFRTSQQRFALSRLYVSSLSFSYPHLLSMYVYMPAHLCALKWPWKAKQYAPLRGMTHRGRLGTTSHHVVSHCSTTQHLHRTASGAFQPRETEAEYPILQGEGGAIAR